VIAAFPESVDVKLQEDGKVCVEERIRVLNNIRGEWGDPKRIFGTMDVINGLVVDVPESEKPSIREIHRRFQKALYSRDP
jgi:hypothetical protein